MEVIVVGGGLSGLVSSILLSRAGFDVRLFEEKKYPFQRVCGEYISNEVIPFLEKEGLYPYDLHPSSISQFHLTSNAGRSLKMALDLGGFGVSRFKLDQWLAEKAKESGVAIIHERVTQCEWKEEVFEITSKEGAYTADLVIGAFGKRSWLDRSLDRPFLQKRSPYVGVKYHVQTEEVARDVIELHNFDGGYCGVSRVEGDTFNLCYLSHRRNFKRYTDVKMVESEVLHKNPHLKRIFNHADLITPKPVVINEITFEKKEPVFNHVLMAGDSAGMITPLCGNGMAMAIHAAKLLSELVIHHAANGFDRLALEEDYRRQWHQLFSGRLWAGRNIQRLFGATNSSGLAVGFANVFPPFARYLMSQTHGQPF